MAQHDYNIANQSGADFRADLNNALLAIATVNSGSTEPSTTFAHQLWVDTSSSVLKIRNAADNAWITTGVSITASNTFTGDLTGNVTGNLTGNVTGNVTGDLTGNADSADTLSTARTISLSGDVVGSVSFDGSTNVDIDTVVQINSITLGTDTTGDYVESMSGGTGVTVTGGTGEGSTPSIAIGQAVATTDDVTFNTVTATDEFVGDIDGSVRFTAKADESLSKGDVIYVSGVSGNTPTVGKAKADDASKMPAFGLAAEDANANNNLQIVTLGNLTSVDTSNESVGEILYVSTTAGEYATTAPSGESAQIQNIGKVLRSHAVNGSIRVGGAGRSNATPNLDDGKIFIGNASNQAITSTLDTSIVVENTNLYYTTTRANTDFDTRLATKDTGDLTEGSNLYYTTARANTDFDTRLATKSTTDLAEGTNLYYTSARFDSAFTSKDTDDLSEGTTNLYYTTTRFDSAFGNKTTADLTENTNLYYTDTRANSAIDARVTKAFVDALNIQAASVDANSVTLGTDTVGNYVATITGTANKITVSGSGSESANITLSLPDDVQIADSLTVAGNLTVNGTLTSLDTTNLDIEDNLFQLNAGLTGSPVNDSGMLINRGTADNGIFMWDESVDKFTLGLTTADGTSTGNITLNSLGTLVANIEGDVTGTIQTAAQPNITSLGTLTSLNVSGNIDVDGTTNLDVVDIDGAVDMASTLNVGGVVTANAGIDVTGTVTADGLTIDGGGTLRLNASSTNDFFTIQQASTHVNLIADSSDGAGNMFIKTANSSAVDLKRIRIQHTGDISFYEDTGTTAKFFWDASAESLGIGTTSPSSTLEVKGASATSNNGGTVLVTDNASLAANIGGTIALRGTDGSADRTYGLIKAGKLNSTSGAFDGYLSLQTRTNGQANTIEAMRIDENQNVGIGTTSPSSRLTYSGSFNATSAGSKPSLTGAGSYGGGIGFIDTNVSGMYTDGSGANLRLFTNQSGSDRADAKIGLSIDGSQNVGIGTTSPDNLLHVEGTTSVLAKLESTGTDTNARILFKPTDNNGWNIGANDNGNFTVFDVTNSANSFVIETGADGNTLVLDSSSNVGIGTSSPAESLHTTGNIRFGDTAPAELYTNSSELRIGVDRNNDNDTSNVTFYTNNDEKVRIDASGNVGIGTASPDTIMEIVGADPILTIRDSDTSGSTANSRIRFAESGASDTLDNYWDVGLDPLLALTFSKNGTEHARFDLNGNVGIGCTPDAILHIEGSGVDSLRFGNIGPSSNTALRISRDDTSIISGNPLGYLEFGGKDTTSNADTAHAYIAGVASGTHAAGDNPTDLTFGTTPDGSSTIAERMRLDSSGNLMVGKSSDAFATAGVVLATSQNSSFTRDGGNVLALRRNTDGGDMLTFYSATTKVGSVGNASSDLHIDGTAGHSGIRFQQDSLMPRQNGADINGAIDLGYNDGSTAFRFRNLNLSGSIYLGGLGSANALDDYEEGTWTPVYKDSSGNAITNLVNQQGSYTKVGSLVYIQGCLRTQSSSSTSGVSGNLTITGLPFTSANVLSTGHVVFHTHETSSSYNAPSELPRASSIGANSTNINLYKYSGSGGRTTLFQVSDLNMSGNSNFIFFAGTYRTD